MLSVKNSTHPIGELRLKWGSCFDVFFSLKAPALTSCLCDSGWSVYLLLFPRGAYHKNGVQKRWDANTHKLNNEQTKSQQTG